MYNFTSPATRINSPFLLFIIETPLGPTTKCIELLPSIFFTADLPEAQPPPSCQNAILRHESWYKHRPLTSGKNGWGVCLSSPGCHFNTGTPPSPPRFWRKLPKDRVNEEGLWGGQGPRLLPHSSSPALPLCLCFLPASESEEQHKDLALEGKVLYSSRCMTLDKLCHSPQVNEGRTRELTAIEGSHKPYCAAHSSGVCGNITESHPCCTLNSCADT